MSIISPEVMSELSLRKSAGVHYTPKDLADFVARKIADVWALEADQSVVRVLDPAVGEGELLLALCDTLNQRNKVPIEAHGFDIDQTALQEAESRLRNKLPQVTIDFSCGNFLEEVASRYSVESVPSLFSDLVNKSEKFDLVIANPPYVRTQVMGASQSKDIRKQFKLSGRVDLYHAFIQSIELVLQPGGIAGIIVSNRFMTTQSGADLRKSISEKFDILHIWDLGDTKLFEAAVLPAVLLLKKKHGEAIRESRFTSIYSVASESDEEIVCHSDVFATLELNGKVEVANGCQYRVQQGLLNNGNLANKTWRIATSSGDKWLETVSEHTYCTFADVGKIRVGVKTTADKVFIRSDWNQMSLEERPELLKPLTTHHSARRFKARVLDDAYQILYTHRMLNGKRSVVDLSQFPNAERYLESHRAALESREYIAQAGRKWFEIWVPQNPDIWALPKVIFRDIAEHPTFWMGLDGSVVNGDCYWFTSSSVDKIDLLWMSVAVANSSFIAAFYDHCFHNKLYSGRRRFMTQYVEKFPLPDPESEIAKKIVRMAKDIYILIPSPLADEMQIELEQLIWQAFGLPSESAFEKIAR